MKGRLKKGLPFFVAEMEKFKKIAILLEYQITYTKT